MKNEIIIEKIDHKKTQNYLNQIIGKTLSYIWMDMGTIFFEIGEIKENKNSKGVLKKHGEYTFMIGPSWRFNTNASIKCSIEMTEKQILSKTNKYIGAKIKGFSFINPLQDLIIHFDKIQFITFSTYGTQCDWTIFFNDVKDRNSISSKNRYWLRTRKGKLFIERRQHKHKR